MKFNFVIDSRTPSYSVLVFTFFSAVSFFFLFYMLRNTAANFKQIWTSFRKYKYYLRWYSSSKWKINSKHLCLYTFLVTIRYSQQIKWKEKWICLFMNYVFHVTKRLKRVYVSYQPKHTEKRMKIHSFYITLIIFTVILCMNTFLLPHKYIHLYIWWFIPFKWK